MIKDIKYYHSDANDAVLGAFFEILRKFPCFTAETIAKAMEEVNYKDAPTYPDGCGDPMKDLTTLGSDKFTLSSQIPMDQLKETEALKEGETPEAETKEPASEEAPTKPIDKALAEKIIMIAKKLGFSEDTCEMMEKEAGLKPEATAVVVTEKKASITPDIMEELKRLSN